MAIKISSVSSAKQNDNKIFLFSDTKQLKEAQISAANQKYLTKNISEKNNYIVLNDEGIQQVFVYAKHDKSNADKCNEKLRQYGSTVTSLLNKSKVESATLINLCDDKRCSYFFIEGLSLANYQFLKYKKEKKTLKHSFSKLNVTNKSIKSAQLTELKNIIDAVFFARDLVNEPLSFLTATQLAKECTKIGKAAGLKVEVFNKKKIQS